MMNKTAREEREQKRSYLLSYKRQAGCARRAKDRVTEARRNKMCPSSHLDGMPRGSGTSDLSAYAARIDSLERRFQVEEEKRIAVLEEVTDRIETLDNEIEKDILIYRYIQGLDWQEIAIQLGYGYDYVMELHGKALKNFRFFNIPENPSLTQ